MSTMTKRYIDIESWESGRVPKDVMQVCAFIYLRRTQDGVGPSWKEIADFMNWDCVGEEMRKKMKRLRRWGVSWKLNVPGSTRVAAEVVPFLTVT